MKHQNKIIDYMNENLKGYAFGQLRHAALSRLSYPGADLSAEDFPEIRMPEDVALYLVNNVLHNLPHNDRLKAKGDAAEGEKKDLIDKHCRMIVDGAEDDIRDLRKQGYTEADVRKLAEQYAEEEIGREAERIRISSRRSLSRPIYTGISDCRYSSACRSSSAIRRWNSARARPASLTSCSTYRARISSRDAWSWRKRRRRRNTGSRKTRSRSCRIICLGR